MKRQKKELMMSNNVFGWNAIATGLILLLPYFAMKYDWQVPEPGSSASSAVDWSRGDFLIMGGLVFGMSSLFVLVARKVKRSYRLPLLVIFGVLFLYIWAELAVGIFTNIGS